MRLLCILVAHVLDGVDVDQQPEALPHLGAEHGVEGSENHTPRIRVKRTRLVAKDCTSGGEGFQRSGVRIHLRAPLGGVQREGAGATRAPQTGGGAAWHVDLVRGIGKSRPLARKGGAHSSKPISCPCSNRGLIRTFLCGGSLF